jgi:hypothetical protein
MAWPWQLTYHGHDRRVLHAERGPCAGHGRAGHCGMCARFSCRSHLRCVDEGLGDGRSAVQCRHGPEGGGRRGSEAGDDGPWRLLQPNHHGRHIGLRDAKPPGERREGAGGGIAEGAQRSDHHREEHGHSQVGCALAHCAQASLHHLELIGVSIGENQQQSILICWEWTVLVDGHLAGSPGFPQYSLMDLIMETAGGVCDFKMTFPHMRWSTRYDLVSRKILCTA